MSIEISVNNATEDVKTYADAIFIAGQKLVEKKAIDSAYIDACIDRETDFPTGLLLANGKGVAIPHGNSDFVNNDSISVVRVPNKVEFGRMEDKSLKVDCSLIFNLALSSGQQHVSILRKIIRLIQEDGFLDNCQSLGIDEAQAYISQRIAE